MGDRMKKLLLIISVLLFSFNAIAQEESSGSISLMIDKENVEVPVNSVSIRKGNNTLVSIHGQIRSGDKQTSVDIEFNCDSLTEKIIPPEDLSMKIDISTSRFYGFVFSFRSGSAEYMSIGERYKYDDVDSEFRIESVDYKEGSFIIAGSFSGSYSISSGKAKDAAQTQIKNGKFEIKF